MSKREATMFAAQGVDVDAPRAKRHKLAAPAAAGGGSKPGANQDTKVTNGVAVKQEEDETAGEDREMVKERGLRLWQIVKDAVNKECVISSFVS